MKKAYLCCLTHALPTAILIGENGETIAAHSGEDADDAIYWFNHYKKGEGYDVTVIDQELMHKVLYEKASTDILREKYPEFADILDKNVKANAQ